MVTDWRGFNFIVKGRGLKYITHEIKAHLTGKSEKY